MNKYLIGAIATAMATVAFAKQEADRYYAVKTDHLESYTGKAKVQLIETAVKYSLVKLTPNQVMSISTHVHETENNCGGVVDLSVDTEDNKVSIETAFRQFLKEPVLREYKYEINDTPKVISILGSLDKAVYENDLKAFTSFPNRFANNENGVKAAHWLRDKAQAYANDYGRTNVSIELFETPRYKQPSVVVKIKGQDSSLPGVLVGGHLDSYSGNKPAVDDDASGTIASLEVLRAVFASGKNFQRDIYVAFYAAEEWGLHGSKKVANVFQQRGVKLKGVMQLDMIAYSQKTEHYFTFVRDYTSDKLTDYTKQLAKHYLAVPDAKIADTKCGYGCSDHASWHKKSYAAVTPFEAEMRSMNGRLHTADDTMALADIEHAFRFVQLATAFVAETADPM